MFRIYRPTQRWFQRAFHLGSQNGRPLRIRNVPAGIFASSVLVTGSILLYSTNRIVYGDTLFSTRRVLAESEQLPRASNAVGELNVIVWGSNREHLLSPDTPEIDTIKTPSVTGWFKNVALRDMALHQRHAACIDPRGDVYQWGDSFNIHPETRGSVSGPMLTLRGKNIVSLQLTASQVFALSASGNIYVLPAESTQVQASSSTSWWPTAWLSPWPTTAPVIAPREKLKWGEKFISISAGDDHLLALTSSGRTFAHPITINANSSGQLGFRKFEVIDGKERRMIELTPKAVLDPLAKASAFIRRKSETISDSESTLEFSNGQKFCNQLYEIPALKEVEVSQIATGRRSSYVRTSAGNVLGWGANENGQIGLGSNVIVDTITVPTEIVLWRAAAERIRTRCTDISAGGDLACFTVERRDEGIRSIDLLVCGDGQWGGLGNNLFSNAQGVPVRAKAVSGLFEYDEQTQTQMAISPHAISVSPTGHVLLTLDTFTRSMSKDSGRDLFVWGANYEYALGNGKRRSIAVPTALQTADGDRFMLRRMRAREVNDLSGSLWKRGVLVEQKGVSGYGNSVVYWQIP